MSRDRQGLYTEGPVEEQRLQCRRQSAVLLGAQTDDSIGGRTQEAGVGRESVSTCAEAALGVEALLGRDGHKVL
jgi:hypothetical protein